MINRSGKFTKQKAKYKGKLHEDIGGGGGIRKRGDNDDTKRERVNDWKKIIKSYWMSDGI